MAHVFVSYCHEDVEFAPILRGKLRDAGLAVRLDLNLAFADPPDFSAKSVRVVGVSVAVSIKRFRARV